jgi:hypothetical protein
MTSRLWGQCLRHEPSFPARLDDEFSFLSIRLRLPMNEIAIGHETCPANLRIVYRREYPQHRLSRRQLLLDIRVEVFDLPSNTPDDAELPIQISLIDRIREETIRAGLCRELPETGLPDFISKAKLAPDPGDLAGHLVFDATVFGASFYNLEHVSNHKLLALKGRQDIELLRLPPEATP